MDGELPQYIKECFTLFKVANESILIDFHNMNLSEDIEYIINRLLYKSVDYVQYRNVNEIAEINDKSNLIKSQFIELFPNLRNINIKCGYSDKFWQFSIINLIKEILESKIRNNIQIRLEASWRIDKDDRRSWLYDIWSQLSPTTVEIVDHNKTKISHSMESEHVIHQKIWTHRKKDILWNLDMKWYFLYICGEKVEFNIRRIFRSEFQGIYW